MEPTTPASRTLTLADLDAAKDLGLERVEVPEWGGAVYVRELPADQGIDMSDEMAAIPKEKGADALFVLLGHCLANADGSPLFGSVAEARQHLRPRS
ncbi:MAG: hypothetical protein JW767_04730, partial [Thermoleophilia bacterium]|nr:hypothetical protein [Thermoleophilia bacterium]